MVPAGAPETALGQIWRKGHLDALPAGLALFAVAGVLLCSLLAVLSYRLVELPLAGFFQRRRR